MFCCDNALSLLSFGENVHVQSCVNVVPLVWWTDSLMELSDVSVMFSLWK